MEAAAFLHLTPRIEVVCGSDFRSVKEQGGDVPPSSIRARRVAVRTVRFVKGSVHENEGKKCYPMSIWAGKKHSSFFAMIFSPHSFMPTLQ